MHIARRSIFGSTAAMLSAVAGTPVMAQRARSGVPVRPSGPVEVVYKAPHGQPNGLGAGANPGELWVQDRGVGRQVTLIRASDGTVIREVTVDAIGPSGVAMDDEGVLWTSDTHGVMLVASDAQDGHTIAKYFVPGACRMYEKAGDPPRRVSPLKLAYPGESRAMGDNIPHNEFNDTGSGLGPGRVAPQTQHFFSATGGAGLIFKGDLLIYSCLSARTIVVLDKKSWKVQDVWQGPGNRALGLCWADALRTHFWVADANQQTFHLFSLADGAISDSIVLPADAPVVHGCQIVDGHMYFTDDQGWICRFKL
jgi:hypothetical protein